MLIFLLALVLCFSASGETSLGERVVVVHAAVAEGNTASCRQDWASKLTCFELSFQTKPAEKTIAAFLDVPARIPTIRNGHHTANGLRKRHHVCTSPPRETDGYAGFK
jgi:hypothetical protein